MGKAKKEHRKKVAKRNQRIEQAKKAFKNKFQEELLKQIELEKGRIAAEKKESENTVENTPENNDTEQKLV
jgi:hypothetical protein